MIKTVQDLIEALTKFDPYKPICIRIGIGEYFSDWHLHDPSELYPGDKVCLSTFEQYADDELERGGQ